MSFIRPQLASRLLLTPAIPLQRAATGRVRWQSQKANDDRPSAKTDATIPPAPPPGGSSMVREEDSAEGLVDHQPDYNAPIDHGTSQFSSVPKRVQDGSEPVDFTPAAVVSGAPVDLQGRTIRIYRPAKTATQSGDWHSHHWRMDWDVLQKGYRWENPLMGWQSTADYMQGTHLNFNSKEDAIHFAQKQGYEYFVQEPNERRFVPKAYANNFLHSPKPLKKIPTK